MITIIPFRFVIFALLLIAAAIFGGIKWFIATVVFFLILSAFA